MNHTDSLSLIIFAERRAMSALIETLTVETFKSKIFNYDLHKEWKFSGSRPAIVDFYADWCGPCKMLAPILDEVAEEYKGRVDIFKIDTEATPELASIFGIKGIPSLLFVPLNGEPAMNAGLIPKETFEQAIADIFEIQK